MTRYQWTQPGWKLLRRLQCQLLSRKQSASFVHFGLEAFYLCMCSLVDHNSTNPYMNRQTAWDEEYDPYKAASGERSSLIFDDTYRTPQNERAKEANTAGISVLQWFSLLSIIGGFVLGCVITVANHFVFAYFNGKRSDQFPQFWVTALKNILPKLAHVSWTASLSCSVAQAVRFPTSHYVVRCADYLSTHTDMVYHSAPIIYTNATR